MFRNYQTLEPEPALLTWLVVRCVGCLDWGLPRPLGATLLEALVLPVVLADFLDFLAVALDLAFRAFTALVGRFTAFGVLPFRLTFPPTAFWVPRMGAPVHFFAERTVSGCEVLVASLESPGFGLIDT